MAMISPTTSAVISTGAERISISKMLPCMRRTILPIDIKQTSCLSDYRIEQLLCKQSPPVHKYKQHELKRHSNLHRRKHHHTHGHENTCHNHIDYYERYVEQNTDFKCYCEFMKNVCGNKDMRGNIRKCARLVEFTHCHEHGNIARIFRHLAVHEYAHRRLCFLIRLINSDLTVGKRLE